MVLQSGIFPQLAALETILYPTSRADLSNHALAASGMLEIVPMEAPLTLFVWSASRIVPVRITEFSVTEEAFDTNLNPIRAKVSLGMRVLSVNDLGFDHRGSSIYLAYQRRRRRSPAIPASGNLRPSASERSHERRPLHAVQASRSRRSAPPAATPVWRSSRSTSTATHTPTSAAASCRSRNGSSIIGEHVVTQGERLDHIAARYFGDPELFWRLCDANRAMRPEELTETIGRRLGITLPEGVPSV